MDLSDTTQELGRAATAFWNWLEAFFPRALSALLVFVIGLVVARLASAAVTRLLSRARPIEATLRPIIASIVRYTILVVVIVAALGQLGVQTASILAALGAAGLAIGLALQGTLANIAAGLMLLWLRPFRAGDSIESGTNSGTVRELGLFATLLETVDGSYRFVPNQLLWNQPIVNFSRNPARLLTLTFNIGTRLPVDTARQALQAAVATEPRLLAGPSRPEVFVAGLTDTGVQMGLRGWVATADYGSVQREMTEKATRRIEAAALRAAGAGPAVPPESPPPAVSG